jgi:aspartate 1-decarboxylase
MNIMAGFWLLIAIFFCSNAIAKDEEAMIPEDFINRYAEAISTQKWQEVEALIHPNCVATFTSGTYRGKFQVEEIFRKNFDLIKNEKYTISNIHWVIKESGYAVFTFNYHWSGLINGKQAEGGCRGTSVIVKSKSQWQLISEHLGPGA